MEIFVDFQNKRITTSETIIYLNDVYNNIFDLNGKKKYFYKTTILGYRLFVFF